MTCRFSSLAFACVRDFRSLQLPPMAVSLSSLALVCGSSRIPAHQAIIFSMLIVRAHSPSTSSTGPATGLDSISTPTSPQRLWGNRASYAARQNVSIGVTIDLERVVHTDEDTFPSRTDGTFESERDKGKDPAF